MKLRTFIAADMAEAIEAVRHELGVEAIIVSSFTNDAGSIEVTAAIEPDAGRPLSLFELESSLETSLRERLRTSPHESHHPETDPAPVHHSGIAFDETLLARALDAQGTPAGLRDALVAAAAALDNDDALAALAIALHTRFSFDPLPACPPMPVMLVGLPGSGKTVTMAKLAAGAVIEGVSVDLITTDTARAGAAQQGEAYGRLLNLDIRSAGDIEGLALLLNEHEGRAAPADRSTRPCFIDTASVNPFDGQEFAALKRLAEGARFAADTEPVLVLSAAGDARLLCETASHFSSLGARRLIATQVDISRRIGAVLAAADHASLALSHISVTPYLARGLAAMNPLVCARLILGTHEARADGANAMAAS